MSRVKIQYLLEKIEEQVEKKHYLNALSWCFILQKWLLETFSDVLKEIKEDGNAVE